MKKYEIEVNWKHKVFIGFLVLASIGLLGVFSYQAIQDMGQNTVIMTTDEFNQLVSQSFK